MSWRLDGRVAIVTGASGALGESVSRRLLAAGATVAVPHRIGREPEALLKSLTPEELERVLPTPVDVTLDREMARFADDLTHRHGRLDILVCAVGAFAPGTLLSTDRETWDSMLGVNLTSVFTTTRAVLPHMVLAGQGRVVTVSARAVVPPRAGFIAYTAAKAGLIAFTQALAEEMRGHRVTVNAVLPSTIDTAANRRAMPGADRSAWVTPEAIAETVAFLVSDDAALVTGTLVQI